LLFSAFLIGWAVDHDIRGILTFSKEPRRQDGSVMEKDKP
jgi:hypothetical protein